MDINELIRSYIPKFLNDETRAFISPNIPEKKLNNAIKNLSPEDNPSNIIGLIDVSLFKQVNAGMVFFGDKFSYNVTLGSPVSLQYKDLTSVDFEETRAVNEKGKEIVKRSMEIIADDVEYSFPEGILNGIEAVELEAFLNELIAYKEELNEDLDDIFAQEDQTKPLESMDLAIKMNYVKILVNFALDEGNDVSSEEYTKLLSLMIRIKLEAENRLVIREYMYSEEKIATSQLIENLENETTSTEFALISQSLIKDLLDVFELHNELDDWKENEFLTNLIQVFEMEPEEVEVFVSSIKYNQDIINKRLDDTEITKALKDLSAKALGVGVPMIALYFSGSVGVSAAGISSGLAAFGVKMFGMSKMFTGVGAIALIGAGTYEGAKRVTGMKDLENNKQREYLIQQIIMNNQLTLNAVIEDVNLLSQRLLAETQSGLENQARIQQLAEMIATFSTGANQVTNQIDYMEREGIIAKLPAKLDVDRLNELTNQATLKEAREFVLACYSEEDNGLNFSIPRAEMAKLHEIMENIGYLSLKEASLATAKSKGKSFLKQFTSGENDE